GDTEGHRGAGDGRGLHQAAGVRPRRAVAGRAGHPNDRRLRVHALDVRVRLLAHVRPGLGAEDRVDRRAPRARARRRVPLGAPARRRAHRQHPGGRALHVLHRPLRGRPDRRRRRVTAPPWAASTSWNPRVDYDTRVGAYAVIVRDEHVLLSRWAPDPTQLHYRPGRGPSWTLPGGGLEA